MAIRNECYNIIKLLDEKYRLGGLKGVFNENPCYLGSTVRVYYVNKYCGGVLELRLGDTSVGAPCP